VDPDRSAAACVQVARIGVIKRDPMLEAEGTLLAAGWRILVNGWHTEDAQTYATALADLRRFGGEVNPFMNSRIQILHSNYREAYEGTAAALIKLTEANGLWDLAPLLSAKAIAALHLGKLGEALRSLTTGIELAQRNHNPTWLGIFRGYMIWVRFQACDFRGVRELSNSVSEAGMAPASLQVRLQTNTFKGFADLASDQLDSAFACFRNVRDHSDHPKSLLSWYWRGYARLGLSEAWLASGQVANAELEAATARGTVGTWREAFMKALAWEVSARVALTAADQKRSEEYIGQALDIVEAVEVPLASWQVHATAWDVHREINQKKADGYRSKAQALILQIAESLEEFESSRELFLRDSRVRRVLGNTPVSASQRSPSHRRQA